MSRVDERAFAENRGALQHIAKLSNVARPLILEKGASCLSCQTSRWPVECSADLLQKCLAQRNDIGRTIAATAKKLADRRVVIVASSDFTHYESRSVASRQDQAAVEQILALDPDGLKQIVDNQGITMCGVGPVAAALVAARALGATTAEQVAYATSGDKTQDNDSVTGFAGIVIR